MIFSTSFPMFIDSLKSIRLYNWARKKNYRHINTRVCSLKNWNCLVFCYNNPTTIELIWLYFEVSYLYFSCCLFMLIIFWVQEEHKEGIPVSKNAIRTDFLHSKKPCLVKKTFQPAQKYTKLTADHSDSKLFECCMSLQTNCFSSRFFCQNILYLHITYILLLLLYIIIFMHNNCNWWQEKDKKKNSWHTKQAFALNKTLSSPKNC